MPVVKKTKSPRLESVNLVDLADSDPSELRSRGGFDGQRFVDGDLSGCRVSGSHFVECELNQLRAAEIDLRSTRWHEVRIEQSNFAVCKLSGSEFKDVEIVDSRLGAVEWYDSKLQSVRFEGCRFDWMNLRSSQLNDVLFTNCVISELDLYEAILNRTSFQECRIDSLNLGSAKLADVDFRGADLRRITELDGLRGATLSPSQIVELAEVFAEHLGIRSED